MKMAEQGGNPVIRVAICDDEKEMSDNIRMMTTDFFGRKNMEITIRQFFDGEELLKYEKPIDILFLDIQMKGMQGFPCFYYCPERNGFSVF